MPRVFLSSIAVALAFCATVTVVGAQSSATVHKVGWLGHGNPPPARTQAAIGDFLLAMRDAGYVEGRNLTVEYRYANGSVDRLPELVAELVRLKVDVIVTSGEPAALATKRVTSTIPIVMTEMALDPVKVGLVASLGRPDGNVTGLTSISDELWRKRLEVLKGLVPRLTRAAVLVNPANPANAQCQVELRSAAKAIDVQVDVLDAGSATALERTFAAIERTRPDAIVTCGDSVTLEHAGRIGDFALARRLPTMAPLREYVQAGSLISFGANLPAERRRAAHYVARLLKGSKPASLPVEQPTHFELVVNVKTANALGLTLPPQLMVLADDLIQ
jgi:putative ABC transport system substrate-binding protein